jgi:hypothetical protein
MFGKIIEKSPDTHTMKNKHENKKLKVSTKTTAANHLPFDPDSEKKIHVLLHGKLFILLLWDAEMVHIDISCAAPPPVTTSSIA